MTELYVIVVEAGLSGNAYGATISTHGPTDLSTARATLQAALRGELPEIHKLYRKGMIVRVSEDQYLNIGTGLAGAKQTRLTVAAVVSET
ncbi:hypothetical protein [Microbacterium gorillae]|uniref:hypothetical protein n=1 Tax=Microbacterium gorillae TaxID=1231063 RepID=UPI00058BA6D4|nr:hypothetical protein [Microbacterium gorillae]